MVFFLRGYLLANIDDATITLEVIKYLTKMMVTLISSSKIFSGFINGGRDKIRSMFFAWPAVCGMFTDK